MTVTEAAHRLFVSKTHVLSLLASGDLVEDLPRDADGEPSVTDASVEAYLKARQAKFIAYNETQSEENDPLGL